MTRDTPGNRSAAAAVVHGRDDCWRCGAALTCPCSSVNLNACTSLTVSSGLRPMGKSAISACLMMPLSLMMKVARRATPSSPSASFSTPYACDGRVRGVVKQGVLQQQSRLAYAVLHVSQQWELEAADAALVARRFSPGQVHILAVDTAANEVTVPDSRSASHVTRLLHASKRLTWRPADQRLR